MKKALITIFSIIAVLLIIMLVWNLVFGQNIIGSIWSSFANRINKMWQGATGQTTSNLLNADQTVQAQTTMTNQW